MTKRTYPDQVFTGANGMTVEYPAGYRTFQDYVDVLHLNLYALNRKKETAKKPNAHTDKLIAKYEAWIVIANKALGI